MSDPARPYPEANSFQKPVPPWIGAGLIGLIVGAGGTLLVMRSYAPSSSATTADSGPSVPTAAPGGGGPMGMPGMGGGMMGGGMMGGGPRGKRNLTSLVGKLDLLTRETLHLELTPEQSAKIADHLIAAEKAEEMTEEQAQKEFETLESLLSPEQKAIANSISLPFSRSGGGGPGAGAMMSSGGPDEQNPFRQETNQQRLHDLLARIQPGSFKPAANDPAKTEPTNTESAKSEADKTEAKGKE